MSGIVPINSRNYYSAPTLVHGAVLTLTAALAARAVDCLTVFVLTAGQPGDHVYTYPPVSRAAQMARRVCGALGACALVQASIAYNKPMALFLLFLSLMHWNCLPLCDFIWKCHFNTYNHIHSWIGFKNLSPLRANDLPLCEITNDVVIDGDLIHPLIPDLTFQNLTIKNCSNLKDLQCIYVKGNLTLTNCSHLENLTDFKVSGNLNITNCSNLQNFSWSGAQFTWDRIQSTWDWGSHRLTDDSIKNLIAHSAKGEPIRLASAEQKKNKEIALAAIRKDASAFVHIDQGLKGDEAIREVAYDSIVYGVGLLCITMKDVLTRFIQADEMRLPLFIVFVNKYKSRYYKYKGDQEIHRAVILEAFGRNGLVLQHIPHDLQDRDMVRAALQQNGLALQFVVEYLRDGEYREVATLQNPIALQFVPFQQQRNSFGEIEEWVVRAVEQDNKACRYVDPTLVVHPSIVQAYANMRAMSLAKPLQEVLRGARGGNRPFLYRRLISLSMF